MPRFYDDTLDDRRATGLGNPTPPPAQPPAAPTPPPAYVPPSATDPANYDTNISKDQWQAWEKNKAPAEMGCPAGRQYVGREGQCASKPDDCPDGKQVVGNDASGTARCVDSASLNKPAAAAPAATAAAPAAPTGPPPGPATFTPAQVSDPLKATGLGSADSTNIQYNPMTASAAAPAAAAAQTEEQKKKKATGLGTPSMTASAVPLGMH